MVDYESCRDNSNRRGYGRRWQKARRSFLMTPGHILCAACQSRNICEPATVVDHIQDHKGNFNLFWDMKNWQSLCKPCHDRKTLTGTTEPNPNANEKPIIKIEETRQALQARRNI